MTLMAKVHVTLRLRIPILCELALAGHVQKPKWISVAVSLVTGHAGGRIVRGGPRARGAHGGDPIAQPGMAGKAGVLARPPTDSGVSGGMPLPPVLSAHVGRAGRPVKGGVAPLAPLPIRRTARPRLVEADIASIMPSRVVQARLNPDIFPGIVARTNHERHQPVLGRVSWPQDKVAVLPVLPMWIMAVSARQALWPRRPRPTGRLLCTA